MIGDPQAVMMTLNPSNSRDLKPCQGSPDRVVNATPIMSSSPRRRESSLLIQLGSRLRGNDN
jgi:hypothetical protein